LPATQEQAQPETSPSAGIVEIPLRRPGFWSLGFTFFFGFLVLGTIVYYMSALPRLWSAGSGFPDLLPHLLVPLSLCGVALVVRAVARPRAIPPIAFHEFHMVLPRYVESRRLVKVPYDDILSVDLRGRSQSERLLIGTRRRMLVFPRPSFAAADAVDGALKELYARILRLPQGPRIVEEMARRRRLALAAMSNPTTVTHLLLALWGIIFLLEFVAGAFETPLGQLRFGAASPVLIRRGEVYRLISSMLLHSGAVHLYFDGLAVFFLGSILERLLGRTRMALILLVSGLGGTLAATLTAQGLYTLDGSAAVCGLLGAVGIVMWRLGTELPVGFAQPMRWWPAILLLVASPVLYNLNVNVCWQADAAGVVFGALVALLVVDRREALDPKAPARLSLRNTASVLAVLFGLGLLVSVGEALRPGGTREQRLARTILDDVRASPSALNELAWRLVCYPKAAREQLELAAEAAERADAALPGNALIIDTVAAVRYRLEQHDLAIDLERPLVDDSNEEHAPEHFAKFLAARLAKSGPALRGGASVDALQVGPAEASLGRLPEIKLGRAARLQRGLTAYVLARRDTEIVGLVRLRLGAGAAAGATLSPTGREGAWPRGVEYAVALIDASCAGCAGETSEFSVWNLEVRMDDLP
jgi:rhomboid protease GluP